MTLTKATYSMIEGAPVNVLDYGAVGNGVADDTAAIQAAIDANKGGVILLPSGYTFKGAAILLDGATYDNTKIVIDGEYLLTASPNTSATNFQGAMWAGIIFRDCNGCLLDAEGWINGNRANQPDYEFVHCVVLAGVTNWSSTHLRFKELRADGLYIAQKNVTSSSTNSSGITIGVIEGYNSANDGRNLISIISGDNGSIGVARSFQIGGTVGGFTMPGGVDFEADHTYQSIKNWTVGTINVTTAGSSGLGIGGQAGADVTRNIRIGTVNIINTAAATVVDGAGNTTLTNNTCLNVLYAADVTIASYAGKYTNAYGSGIGILGCDNVRIKGIVEHVFRGVFASNNGVQAVTNCYVDVDVDDTCRYGFLTDEVTNCTFKGKITNPATGYFPGSLFAVIAQVAAQTQVIYSVSVPYSANWTRTYRNGGLGVTFTDCIIKDCEMLGAWPQGAELYGDIVIPRYNVKGITDQAAVPLGAGTIWTAGQVVDNNTGVVGQPRAWTFSSGGAWVSHGNL